jgi:HK97 gp10 family phage protein
MAKFKTPIRVEIDTSKVAALVQRLADVDKKAARKAMKQGINEVTNLVLAEAKKLVPQRTGQLCKSLGRFVQVKGGGRVIFGVVKPQSGVWMAAAPGLVGRQRTRNGKTSVFVQKFRTTFEGRPVNPVHYAHLVEYGRAAVTIKKKKVLAGGGVIYGTHVSAMAPRPFMRPAWEKHKYQSVVIMERHLNEAMQAFWKRSR